MKKRPPFINTVVFACWAIGIWAFSISQCKGQIYSVQAYYERDGLPTNIIADVTQDQAGVLHVLTDDGLATYDGTHWEVIHTDQNLPTSWKSYLTQLPTGGLLTAGLGESGFTMAIIKDDYVIAIPNDSLITHTNTLNSNLEIGKRSSSEGQSTTQVFLCQVNWSHLWDFSTEEWQHMPNPPEVASLPIGLMYREDTLVLRTYEGLYRWDISGQWVPYHISGLPSQHIIKWQEIPGTDQDIIIGNNWVGIWENEGLSKKWLLTDTTFSHENDITFSNDGHIYFSSQESYYLLHSHTGALQKFTTNHPDAIPKRARIHIDHEGNLWIGTYRGIFKVNSFRFLNYTQASGLFGTEGAAILELPDQSILTGHNRGFSIIKNQEVIHTEETLSVAEYRATRSRFHSLSQQQNTEVWSIAGGAMGLGRMDRQGTIQWNREGRNKDVLGVAHLGDTLLTLDNKHLWYYIGESVVKEVTLEGFFRQVKVLSDGRVVLLGNEGLLEIMGDSVYMHYYQNSPAYSNFYDLEVIDGRIYLGSDRGLLEWSGDSLFQSQTYRFPEQRPIYDILFTSTNQLWLGTNDGVYILQQGRPSRHYSFEDGLAGTEVNRNSLMEGHNGHIWIGTNQGISEYIPDYDLDLSLIPRTSIVSIEASRTSLPTQEDLVLDPEQNTLAFRFRGLSFYNETQINYRIRLHGFDTTWVPLKNSATDITYTNLPTGVSYQLEVQSRLGMGVWSASAKSGSIYIQQPFTSSVLFTVLMIVLAVAIGGLLRFLYGREMNRRWLTKEVAIKTQEIAQSEEELRAQNENLLKINKELDRFVYSASHDLSAPLKSIRGLLHIAKLDKQAGQLQQDQYLAMIDKSVNQLEKFIGELIDFSRNSRLEPKFVSVSLSELVPQLLENLQFMDHFHRVKFSFAWGEGADHIMADEFRLKVILNNLLTNAVKFQRLDRDEVWVKLGSRKTSKGWEIWVEDNGQGIEEDMQPKIFDMFFRANEAASGSGLGLYIAHEAVQRMGGTISLSSIPRQGATFLVFIPFT